MKIKLQNVRISFPHLFTPQEQEGGKKTFNASFLMPPNHPQVKEIEAAMVEVAKAKWGAKAEAILKQLKAGGKVAFRDGDTKANYDGYEGNMFISTGNTVRPLVINRDRSPIAEEDGVIYSGCYVNASIELWAQDNKFGKRINAQLGGVQFLKDGDAFSGGGTAAEEDDFDDLGEGADVDDLV